MLQLSDLDYDLPPSLIAQHPPAERDGARLLVVHRADGRLEDRRFPELPALLQPGDLLVLNDTRVIPARLRVTKPATGAVIELLLVEELGPNDWSALTRPARRVRPGTIVRVDHPSAPFDAEIVERGEGGACRVVFHCDGDMRRLLWEVGAPPLPPYIKRAEPDEADRTRYQTVFARHDGAVAAPTAGLHFTPELLAALADCGVQTAYVTLHVGLGTFLTLTDARLRSGRLPEERFVLSPGAAAALNAARTEGRRIVAVGTTVVRLLETVYDPEAAVPFAAGDGRTSLFIQPGDRFRAVDALITNFHLPRSPLFALVCAFAGPELTQRAYAHAVAEQYRFYSYGDATLIC